MHFRFERNRGEFLSKLFFCSVATRKLGKGELDAANDLDHLPVESLDVPGERNKPILKLSQGDPARDVGMYECSDHGSHAT